MVEQPEWDPLSVMPHRLPLADARLALDTAYGDCGVSIDASAGGTVRL